MTSTFTEGRSEMTFTAHAPNGSHGIQTLSKEQLDGVLRALEVPFEVNLVQWRVTERSDNGMRGLMMPYADPRAYTHRLNSLFTPAGWTRRYTVQASPPVQRSKRGPVRILVLPPGAPQSTIGINLGAGQQEADGVLEVFGLHERVLIAAWS